jgi:rhodanese-related sulfurtransferase
MKRKFFLRLIYCVAALAFFALGAAYAANDEVTRISIEELKKMIDDKADVVILDAQLKEVYSKGHIRGARSFPWAAEITPEDAQGLPKDRLIVAYCDCGPGEADSSDVAAQLIRLGFDNVKVLADPAIRGWTKSGYPIEK